MQEERERERERERYEHKIDRLLKDVRILRFRCSVTFSVENSSVEKYSSVKNFVTRRFFRHFLPTNFLPIRYLFHDPIRIPSLLISTSGPRRRHRRLFSKSKIFLIKNAKVSTKFLHKNNEYLLIISMMKFQ